MPICTITQLILRFRWQCLSFRTTACSAFVLRATDSREQVCDIYGVFISDLYVCIVSAYFDDSLSNLVQKSGGISNEKIQKYCIQLCAGIASLHENGLFLGDFNPLTVLIDKQDNCLLTDIGRALIAS